MVSVIVPAVAQDVESGLGGRSYGREDDEQPIELRRHLDALRRSRWMIVALVVVMTAVAVAVSVALPKSYKATARILYNASADPLANPSSDVVQRQMSTISALITTPSTLLRAAPAAGVGEAKLESKVAASVDPSADIINVTATDGTQRGAQRIANAVARTFLILQRQADLAQLAGARAKLVDQLAALSGTASGRLEAAAIRQRLSELTVSEASAGSELQLAEEAQLPGSPSSPRPVRNGIVVFFAALFIGVLLALGRDQLVPRLRGPRELTRVTDRPVLASIPFVRRRLGRLPTVLSGPEHEAYQTLQATIRFQLPPSEQHVLLVTSALEAEGKTTVTANLGRALARAGHKTLLVSGDMRHPRLHEHFGVRGGPGLAEILAALEYADDKDYQAKRPALRELLQAQTGSRGNLHVLSSGVKPADPARLLLSPSLPLLIEQLRSLGHTYIVIDGTPLLGIADSQAFAQHVDEVLIVSRLDRVRVDDVIEARDLLDRLDVTPLGHVVVGGRRTGSSYYYASRPSEFEPV